MFQRSRELHKADEENQIKLVIDDEEPDDCDLNNKRRFCIVYDEGGLIDSKDEYDDDASEAINIRDIEQDESLEDITEISFSDKSV